MIEETTRKGYEDYPMDEVKIDSHIKFGAVYYDNLTDKKRVRAHFYLREDGKNIASINIIVGNVNKKTKAVVFYSPPRIGRLFQETIIQKKLTYMAQGDLFNKFITDVTTFFLRKDKAIGKKYVSAWIQGIPFIPENLKNFVKYHALTP